MSWAAVRSTETRLDALQRSSRGVTRLPHSLTQSVKVLNDSWQTGVRGLEGRQFSKNLAETDLEIATAARTHAAPTSPPCLVWQNTMSSQSQSRIGAPFSLASLPRPGAGTAGRTQAAGVYSISGTNKKKRAEVAVAVDGEGISVYSVCILHISPQLPV